MSEEFLIEQLDEAIDAIIARDEAIALTSGPQVVSDLASLAIELRLMPREGFKTQLRDALKRSTAMSTTGTERQESPKNLSAGDQTITPYLTVKRPEQLVEFVKQVFRCRTVSHNRIGRRLTRRSHNR